MVFVAEQSAQRVLPSRPSQPVLNPNKLAPFLWLRQPTWNYIRPPAVAKSLGWQPLSAWWLRPLDGLRPAGVLWENAPHCRTGWWSRPWLAPLQPDGPLAPSLLNIPRRRLPLASSGGPGRGYFILHSLVAHSPQHRTQSPNAKPTTNSRHTQIYCQHHEHWTGSGLRTRCR